MGEVTFVLDDRLPNPYEPGSGYFEEYAAWDESEHPRHPEGHPQGGRFAPKGADADLRAYLEMVASHGRSNWEYGSIEEYVLKNGQSFEFSPGAGLPAGVRPAKAGQCFMNAYHLARDRKDLTYVEGYAMAHGVPLAHAWAVDSRGRVVDPTWAGVKGAERRAYFGVKMPIAEVERAIFARKKYGVLHNPEQGFPLLRGREASKDLKWDESLHPRGRTTPGSTPGSFAPAPPGDVEKLIAEVEADPRVMEAERFNATLGDARDFPGVRDAFGEYTPEAAEENRRIAESFLRDEAKSPPGQPPLAVIMLGKPGAGKTTVLSKFAAELPEYVDVNPDVIKEKIPGYTVKTSAAYHERSSDISKTELVPRVVEGRYNAVFDATGRNPEKMETLGRALNARGYRVMTVHVTTDDYTAAKRTFDRFVSGGRYVPIRVAARDYVSGPQLSYERLKVISDEWRQYDTTGKLRISDSGVNPRLLGVGTSRGGGETSEERSGAEQHGYAALRGGPEEDRRKGRDYSQLESALNDLEDQALSLLGPAIEESRDRFLAYVGKSLGPDGVKDRAAWLERLDLKGWGPAQDAFGEMLRQGWEHGRRYARAVAPSIRTMAAPTSFAPRASLEWLKAKQLYVSGVAKDDLLKRAKAIILQGLKIGEGEDKTMEKLRRAWSPYVEDEVDPSAMVRLRTIVRTNTTEALNEGIVTEARSPDMKGVIKSLIYVAVLDERTTPVCELLHGTQIWPDDPRLDALVPPNHFNCRSILDPVIDDDEYDPDALLSVATYKQAVSLIQPGFGGDKAVNLSQQEVAQ